MLSPTSLVRLTSQLNPPDISSAHTPPTNHKSLPTHHLTPALPHLQPSFQLITRRRHLRLIDRQLLPLHGPPLPIPLAPQRRHLRHLQLPEPHPGLDGRPRVLDPGLSSCDCEAIHGAGVGSGEAAGAGASAGASADAGAASVAGPEAAVDREEDEGEAEDAAEDPDVRGVELEVEGVAGRG